MEERYYGPQSAYWVFNSLDALADIEYEIRKAFVRSIWDDFEATEFRLQDEIERNPREVCEGKES